MKDTHGGNIWEASKKSGLNPCDVIDFSASINPLGAPIPAKKAAIRALSLAGAYPDPGQTELRRALALHNNVGFENVIAANGSTELIYLVPRLFAPGRALIVEPAFSEYRRALTIAGWKVDSFIAGEKSGFLPSAEKFKKKLGKRRYKLVWLANPSNPVGTLLKKDDVMRLYASCRAVGATFVVDEAFMDFTEDESVKKEAVRQAGIIVLCSMTKFYSMAGLRLGYAVASEKIIKNVASALPPWSVNTVASLAGIAALGDVQFRKKTLKWLEIERQSLFDGINATCGLQAFDSTANYITVKVQRGALSANELTVLLFKKGILIRDLSAWRGLGPKFFRVAVKDKKSNIALVNALKAVLSRLKMR
jgi:threonine-phosphate decarboxylase